MLEFTITCSTLPGLKGAMMYEYRFTLDRVVDGDTIDIDIDLGFNTVLKKQRVRLYGMNTPESRTRDLEEKAAGLAAKARLIDLLEGGEKLHLQTALDKKAREKYGRILGIIYADGINLNQTLMDEGHAIAYFGGKKNTTKWWRKTENEATESV